MAEAVPTIENGLWKVSARADDDTSNMRPGCLELEGCSGSLSCINAQT